ncbi:NRDE family protein [Chitinophaga filiformis]|uniref:NRDE family protein n=1 Tax=Chitinophaga filiformis TaxID=104663 RepID=A0ABY4HYG3_CHIFI|nr:NRDE family protein [Chitinophaga filiformis]UPK68458.1 NRDE family protein [Chitinophaga filiformis]
MCTVTYIPTSRGIYLTSNRDERTDRSQALPPGQYTRKGTELIYPQDQDAGGSWIALKRNGDAGVLLNGAFSKHQHCPPYRLSRGLIFLQIMEELLPYQGFNTIDLSDIAPFTLVLFSDGQLRECRWDGTCKHTLILDASRPHIWSSATLYNGDAARERKSWFLQWFSSTDPVNTAKVMEFHKNAGKGDLHNGLIINRDNKIRTVSITSIFAGNRKLQMDYLDLQNGTHSTNTVMPASLTTKEGFFRNTLLYLKKIKIRITNWEYWPAYILYGPLYPYWLWLSFKARSLYFFSTANPGIEYSGFVQEKKSDIYKLIPQQYYPRTLLFQAGEPLTTLINALKSAGMRFPLIAKPDVGQKGMQVKLLRSEEELSIYSSRSKVDFLLQEFIDYRQEAGIFYYRIPGQEKGHISGIVGKEYLTVTGDGKSSIEALLIQEDRFLLQLSALKDMYGNFLDTVLPEGLQHILVPYGNHSRGARFTDLHDKMTTALTSTIDRVCREIPGFYYGRLDIKFNSWEEMCEDGKFCIIELNGTGSEPTHIYDPANSLFYAWREICKHWRLLYRISRLNAEQKNAPKMRTSDALKMIKGHYRHLKQLSKV